MIKKHGLIENHGVQKLQAPLAKCLRAAWVALAPVASQRIHMMA